MNYDFETIIQRYNCGSEKWDDLKAFGITPDMKDIVPMGNAEMEFANAPEIVSALQEYVANTVLAYYEPDASFLDSVCGWMDRRYNWEVKSEEIVSVPGLHSGAPALVEAFSNVGDGVICMNPTWPGFFNSIRRNGRQRVSTPLYKKDGRYYIDFDHLEQVAADPLTTLIMFCSPQNPIGRVWTKQELEKVAEICLRNNVTIVSDELHADLTMPGYTHHAFASIDPEVAAHSVICTSPSKSFNLAGLNTSNVIIPNPELRQKYKDQLRRNHITSPNMLGCKACEFAYNRAEKWLDACIQKIDSNAKIVEQFLREELPMIKTTPLEATYLMWLDFRELGIPYKQLEEELMHQARIFIDDGYYFGNDCEGFQRINIACPTESLKAMLKRLYTYIQSKQLLA